MTQSNWTLRVRHPDGRITLRSYRKRKAAEAAAYIAKVANPHATVAMQRTRGLALLWDGTEWFVIVFAIGNSAPVVKRMGSFAAAGHEHDLLCQISSLGVPIFL